MCKKLFYLVSFVLVLSLADSSSADLVAHWRFDEGSGTTAFDSSGNGYDGEFVGTPEWAEGHNSAGAVHFVAEGQGVLYRLGADEAWPTGTVALWVKADVLGQAQYSSAFSGYNPSGTGFQIDTDGGDPGVYRTNPQTGNHFGPVTLDWVHLAITWEGGTGNYYYNGELATSGTLSDNNTTFNKFDVGNNRNEVNSFIGLVDDFRIYDHALSEVEILSIMAGQPWLYAFGPEPKDGAMLEDTWVNLTWKPGDLVISHDVYLGENFEDVNNGAESTFRGNQVTTEFIAGFPGFPYPEGLVPGTTYYWRVDEVNEAEPNSPWKGDIWSFWIPSKNAYNLEPADGVKFVDPNIVLSWTGGFNARLHTVYFGDTFDDVNDAAGGIPQADTTYRPFFGPLELDKTYYWRVDEFDGVVTHKGDVVSFTTKPVIPIADPDLVGWWTLDEGMGNSALDWSGHGNDTTFSGNPQWVDGYHGGALNFDGIDDEVMYNFSEETWSAYTVALWAKAGALGLGEWKSVFSNHVPNTAGFQLDVDGMNPGSYRYNGVNGTAFFGTVTTNWVHIAVTSDGASTILYFNGDVAATIGTADAVFNKFSIGVNRNEDQVFEGIIDDVRVYNRELTQEEVQLAMRGDPLLAWNPNPANGSVLNLRDAGVLSWSAGDNASQHNVYFGTDKDTVTNADDTDTTGVYRGKQGGTSFNTSQDVEWGGGPYYWRIDEVNTDGTVSKGRIWNFIVADFITIDDFESYNDLDPDDPQSNRIFNAWLDGFDNPAINGSIVGYANPPFAERTIVHSGSQSMPYAYDNAVGKSEATLTLTDIRDWTQEGVGVLSLWFYGDTSNAAEPMYVVLNDTAAITNDNPDAALINTWTEWRIDLQAFADQGVNLTNVNTITIGFGNRSNPVAGGSGMVFFDDIRLYRPTP